MNWADTSIMVLDTMGMLSKVYRYATITYVGGGFGKGIHNILEAAVYGKPIIFGPKYHKFKEARDLIQLEAAFSFENETQLASIFEQLMAKKEQMRIQNSLFKYFESNQGAAKKILDILNISP
jgi:3-deoxy-D-manno-octulosonic-acid transferase